MTDREILIDEILIELLAIKLYEHDCYHEKVVPHWTTIDGADRETYREQATVIAVSGGDNGYEHV
jgi:hypothetical protein